MVKAQCLIEPLSPTTDAMLPKEVGFVFYSEPPVIGPREDPCSASMAHDARISTWKPFSAIMAPAVREPMSMAIDHKEKISRREHQEHPGRPIYAYAEVAILEEQQRWWK